MKKKSLPKLEPKKRFYISCDTFATDIAFFVNYSHSEMIKAAKNWNDDLYKFLGKYSDVDDEEDSANLGRMYPLERGYAVRLTFFKDSHRSNIGLLSHEVSHLVSWMLLDRRIKLSKNTDEVYAYLTEELIKKFLFKWY